MSPAYPNAARSEVFIVALLALLLAMPLWIHGASKPSDPPTVTPAKSEKAPQGETLHFNVNWPSGLSLGEAHLSSAPSDGKWTYSFKIDAALPGFTLGEEVKSTASR